MVPPARRDTLLITVLAILFALAQWHLVAQAMGDFYPLSIHEAELVIARTPTWRVYQNRLLGPTLVRGIAALGTDFETAYWLFYTACLSLAGYLAWRLGHLMNGRAGGAIGFFVFQSLFPLLLDRQWLYLWDVLDIIAFYVFFILVMSEAHWRWMVLLFAATLINHESALFIALWLAIDPACRWGLGRLRLGPPRPLEARPMIAGLLCLLLGWLAIELVRRGLIIQELGIRNGVPIVYGARVFHTWSQNWFDTTRAWDLADHRLALLVPGFIVVIFGLAVRVAIARPALLLGACVMCVAQLFAIVFIGLIFETRVFLEFIPFITVSTVLLIKTNLEKIL